MNGETADADMRRKGREKAKERAVVVSRSEKKVDVVEAAVVPEFMCPKCGKGYMSRKGGWYQKHIDSCKGNRSSSSGSSSVSRSSASNNHTNNGNQHDDGVTSGGGSASGSGQRPIWWCWRAE